MSIIEQMLKFRGSSEEFKLPIRIPKPVQHEVKSAIPPTEPDHAVEWMNRDHFVVTEGGKTVIVTEDLDRELKRRVLRRSSFTDFKNFYLNRLVDVPKGNGENNRVALGKFWLEHPRRRQYDGIVCQPRGDANGHYNLWQGFSVPPAPGDWSIMERHIREVIASGNGDLYRYVRQWLAFAVQFPDNLPEVALVMRGKQGTGKGVFARGFGALFGQHFLHLARARNLVGNFNSHLADAIVVFADEAFLADDKEAEGVLKAMITEPELGIERKFQELVQRRNLIHLIVASNNARIINASPEERRFCVLDVSDKRMQDHDYFEAIQKQMENGGRAAMLYDLQKEDLSAFNPRKFPVTGALQDQKIQSMTPAESWWYRTLQAGHLLTCGEGWPADVFRDVLVSDFKAMTGKGHATAQEVVAALKKLLPEGFPKEGPRISVGGERKRTWVLPSVGDCRAHFAAMFKMGDDEWSEDDE